MTVHREELMDYIEMCVDNNITPNEVSYAAYRVSMTPWIQRFFYRTYKKIMG